MINYFLVTQDMTQLGAIMCPQGRIKTKLGLMLLPGKGPIFFLAFKTDKKSRTLTVDAITLY